MLHYLRTGRGVKEADFDQAIVTHANGSSQTMSKDDYYRQPLKMRVDQLCKGQVRFFARGQPVSPLKVVRAHQ
jgi:hypothetical protein